MPTKRLLLAFCWLPALATIARADPLLSVTVRPASFDHAAALPNPADHAPPDHASVDALAAALRSTLPLLPDHPGETRIAMAAASDMLQRAQTSLDARQTVLVVDRSPRVQRLWIAVGYPGGRDWEPLGAVSVSTGKPGRKEHFRTPVGVFTNDGAILGYRAQGTYNENHIRGNGLKGMRVWDFGWQTTDDWRTPGALMAVRLEMHATDPANLEHRLGRWDSEGCIRIPAQLNSFLDHFGLIDARLTEAAHTERRFAALLPKDAAPSKLAGATLIVIDSSDLGAPPSDPARANAMEQPVVTAQEHATAG